MVFGRTKESRKQFIPAVKQSELKPGSSSPAPPRFLSAPSTGSAVSAICSGLDICIAVDTDGSVYALGNKSPVLGTVSRSSRGAPTESSPRAQPMALGPVKAGKIKDPLTGTAFSLKTGEVVGPWCPNFPFSFLFALIEPAGLPVFKAKTSGADVSVEVDINAKTNFESGYWKGILDAQGKADGGYY